MALAFEYALMAGASYVSKRSAINRFPIPHGWTTVVDPPYFKDDATGFEAMALTNGTEIVISFAGTAGLFDPSVQYMRVFEPDWVANLDLYNGDMSDQLLQAVDYYLGVLAAAPRNANGEVTAEIVFTGHSLGGGLAALMGVFFDKQTVTFDQAPFAATARGKLLGTDVATALRDYLASKTALTGNAATARDDLIADLTGYLVLQEASGSLIGIPRSNRVTDYRVAGEALAVFTDFDKIGVHHEIEPGDYYTNPVSLHSQALLTAFLMNDGFRQATKTLSPVLAMVFDGELFAHDTSPSSDKVNFLEHLIRHQIGIRDAAGAVTLLADGALDRFVADLQKIASTPGLATAMNLTQALVAFAMQAYYEGGSIANQADKQLFEQTGGGLHFDRYDIVGGLDEIKGYTLYFKDWIDTLPDDAKQEIDAKLENIFDWYLAGKYLSAEAKDESAFMLGAANTDSLAGSDQNDLLVGLGGNDIARTAYVERFSHNGLSDGMRNTRTILPVLRSAKVSRGGTPSNESWRVAA